MKFQRKRVEVREGGGASILREQKLNIQPPHPTPLDQATHHYHY
jgi:hypothetical protein